MRFRQTRTAAYPLYSTPTPRARKHAILQDNVQSVGEFTQRGVGRLLELGLGAVKDHHSALRCRMAGHIHYPVEVSRMLVYRQGSSLGRGIRHLGGELEAHTAAPELWTCHVRKPQCGPLKGRSKAGRERLGWHPKVTDCGHFVKQH